MTVDDHIRNLVREALPETLGEFADRLDGIARRMEIAADRIISHAEGMSATVSTVPERDRERQRMLYRPDRITILFVVPPRREPQEPTAFYFADSHYYRSIRAAFVVAVGEGVPRGEAFLDYFKALGCWLIALPRDLRRERGRPSRGAKSAELARVTDILRDANPGYVVGIGPQASRVVRAAGPAAGLAPAEIELVNGPKDLWQERFTKRLRKMLENSEKTPDSHSALRETEKLVSFAPVTLTSVQGVLRRHQNRPMRVYQIADLLAPSDSASDIASTRSSIRRLLKDHRHAFDKNGAGIRLAASILR